MRFAKKIILMGFVITSLVLTQHHLTNSHQYSCMDEDQPKVIKNV